MKKLAMVTAALGAVAMLGVGSPANAAMGQCFDAYGRPVGPPHSTDNPPYGMICSVYAQGGQCTHVDPAWAVGNCGYAPSYGYKPDYGYKPYYGKPYYGYKPDNGYKPSYGNKPHYKSQAKPNDPSKYQKHPDPTHPRFSLGPPNTAN
jgi:hypothetical protein